MEYLIGTTLAAAVFAFVAVTGMGRERSFYSTVAMVVASYYGLFATMGADHRAIALESLAAAVFMLLAVLGFRSRPTLVAVALVAHGLFDLVHPRLIDNAGVPSWWPGFCMAFDVALGALVLVLALPRRHRTLAGPVGTGPADQCRIEPADPVRASVRRGLSLCDTSNPSAT